MWNRGPSARGALRLILVIAFAVTSSPAEGERRAPSSPPAWASNLHAPLAAATGIVFGVNSPTGGWKLWDSRKDPSARGWRTAHAVLMLVAEAGFAITPACADSARGEGGDGRYGQSRQSDFQTHKSVALASMRVAVVSWIMMLSPFRPE